ncbi:TPA: S66 peptidase family protein [Legionella pneumophila]
MNKFKLADGESPVIGIVAPSSPVPNGLIKIAVEYLQQQGIRVKLGKSLENSELFAAGTDKERAADIMSFFYDSEVAVILTTNGGTCSIRTLPLLNFDVIRKNPKPIIGYSDATALQLGIYSKTGVTSFTGFNCTDIKNGSISNVILSTLIHCLNNESYSVSGGVTINPGHVTAPLIGGNLMCLLNLMGTPYQPDFTGKILFIEDVGIEPYLVEGMFSQLYVAGVLDCVAGIIIGKFTECSAKHFSSQGGSTEEVINFWCDRIKVPCIKEFSYGHIENRFVLPIGPLASLDATNCMLDIHF